MNDILVQVGAYLAVLVMAYLLLQFLTNGFVGKFMQVKASRGKKVLVEVRGKLNNYFVVGEPEGGWLLYKDNECRRERKKDPKRVRLPDFAVVRKLNINCVSVDEEKSCVIMPDMQTVSGYDSLKWNGLLKRALFNPVKHEDKLLLIIIIVGVAVCVIGLLVLYNEVNSVKEIVRQASTISGGNV